MITTVLFFGFFAFLYANMPLKIPLFCDKFFFFSLFCCIFSEGKKGKTHSAAQKPFSKVLHYFFHEQPFLSPRVNLSELIGKGPLLPNKAVFTFREEEGK